MQHRMIVSGLLAVLVLARPGDAGVIDSTWVGPSGGTWHVAGNWDPKAVPNNVGKAAYHAFIDFKSPGQVNLSPSDATVSNLTIGAQSTLSINNARTLFIAGGAAGSGIVNNSGLLRINSTGSTTNFRAMDGPVTLTGGGTVLLNHAGSSHLRGIGGGSLINVDNTIRGMGHLSSTSATTALSALTNEADGLIVADAAGALQIHASITPITNAGVLRAQDGAILQLNAGSYDNSAGGGGVVEALAGSEVRLSGTAIITGGDIWTEDAAVPGMVRVTSGTPRLFDLTLAGHVHVNNAQSLEMTDVTAVGGTIVVGSTGSTTTLRPVGGALTLTGSCEMILSNSSSNHIRSVGSAGGSLINLDGTIRGAGNLSSTSATTRLDSIFNHADGMIVADASAALQIHGTNVMFTNEGVLRAQDGGTLGLTAGPYTNTGGVIEALPGSEVAIDGATIDNAGGVILASGTGAHLSLSGAAVITGGELHAMDDALVRITGSAPRLVGTDISGDFHINNAQDLELADVTMVDTTNITVGSTGSTTTLRAVGGGPLTLTGGGTVTMSNNNSNHIRTVSGETGSLVNVDCTIRGAGSISSSSASTWLDAITNHGTIVAESTVPLTIFAGGGPVTNTGVLRAQDEATLILNAGTYDNTGGLIEALVGSEVRLAGATVITGGELATEDGNTLAPPGPTGTPGIIRVTSSTPLLTDVAVTGDFRLNNGTTVELAGTIENSGAISLNSSGSTTTLRAVGGPVTLTGGGTITMSNNNSNHIRSVTGDTASLTNVNNTIRGAGNLSSSSASTWLDIINQGTIIADGTIALTINGHSSNGFLNDMGGVLEVTGTGGIVSSGAGAAGGFTNAGHIIIGEARSMARTGDLLQTGGGTTVNGTLSVSSGSFLVQGGIVSGHGEITGAVVNGGGTIAPGGSVGHLHVQGAYTQNSGGRLRIQIDGETPVTEHDFLTVSGNAGLGGRFEPIIDPGFTPPVGTQIAFIEAGSVSGGFQVTSPCEGVKLVYGADSVALEFTGVIKVADLNCDGAVDVQDLLILLGSWGACPNPGNCPTDINDSGAVDVQDLLILLGDWG